MTIISIRERKEVKPCPFCGQQPTGTFFSEQGVTAVNCSNRECIAFARQVSVEQWNTRVEDISTQFMAINALFLMARAQKANIPFGVIEQNRQWVVRFYGELDETIMPDTAHFAFRDMLEKLEKIEAAIAKQARLAEVRKDLHKRLTAEEREAVGLTEL